MRAAILAGNLVIGVIMLDNLGQYPGAIDGTNANVGDAWNGSAFVPPAPAPAPPGVPAMVTMRQARLALLGAGKLGLVQPAIDAMSEPTRSAANIEWGVSNDVLRSNAFVASLGAALGLSSADLDALFIAASAL